MQIRNEKPSQRFHARVSAPLYVAFSGQVFRAKDWSLGGVRLEGLSETHASGTRLDVKLTIPFQGYDIAFTETVEVVWSSGGEAGMRFVDLSARSEELLSHFLDGLLRGHLVAAGETLQHLDAPTSREDKAADRTPEDDRERRRRIWRSRVVMAIYITIAVSVIGYLAVVVYNNFFRIEIDSAYVQAPLQTLAAPREGEIGAFLAAENADLAAGDPVATIDQPDIALRIAEARAALARAEKQADIQRDVLERARENAESYGRIAEASARGAEEVTSAVRRQLASARDQLARLETLAQKGHATESQLDTAREQVAALEEKLARARKERAHARQTDAMAEDGRFFDDDKIVDEIAAARTGLEVARADAEQARARLRALKQNRARMTVRAPAAGRIFETTRKTGENVARGEPIAVFERSDTARTIVAHLDQAHIEHVAQGDTARVLFAGASDWLEGRITRVTRSAVSPSGRDRPGTWRPSNQRSAMVVIALKDLTPAEIRARTQPGLPATVVLRRYTSLPGVRTVSFDLPWADAP